MKSLIWLPSIIISTFISWMPRRVFLYAYKPSTESERTISENVRNETRLAAYYAARTILGRR